MPDPTTLTRTILQSGSTVGPAQQLPWITAGSDPWEKPLENGQRKIRRRVKGETEAPSRVVGVDQHLVATYGGEPGAVSGTHWMEAARRGAAVWTTAASTEA